MDELQSQPEASKDRDLRQALVIRKDLRMPPGKLAAQACHASLAGVTRAPGAQIEQLRDGSRQLVIPLSDDLHDWLSGIFKKVTLRVDSEAELLALHEKAVAAGLNCKLIQDSGLTVFAGVPTYTVLSIGPHAKDVLFPVTGHLSAY